VTLRPPAPLDPARHRTDAFTCGVERLDTWLRAYAGQGQKRDASRTFVVADDCDRVLAYYTLVAAQLEHAAATDAVRRGMSQRFPIPVVLLARLAVDRSHQGSGLGAALLADAVRRSVRAADEVGIRAVIVDALDERAAGFYRRFGFDALATDEQLLMATVAQLRTAASSTPPSAP
jgi:predicted N-acetyltransferase YhbS